MYVAVLGHYVAFIQKERTAGKEMQI